jgi:dihydroflavonol-4-reductase
MMDHTTGEKLRKQHVVVVSGATGFVGRWMVAELLKNGGRTVVGTFQPGESEAELRAALASQVSPNNLVRLRLVPADLHADGGWSDAMAGASALIHTAAAVPAGEPDDRADFITREVAGL